MRRRLTAVMVLALLATAGCGGGSDGAPAPKPRQAASAAPPAATPQPRCVTVPRSTVRVIASHANRRTRFAAGAAAAIRLDAGYAVSLPALAGGSRRMATWFVDRLRAPATVTSGNVEALQITNWPLDTLGPEPVRQSQLCATQRLRGPGPVAP